MKTYGKFAILIIFLISFYLYPVFAGQPVLENFRQSFTAEKIRLVFDLSNKANYSVIRKGNPETFIINLPEASLKKDFKKDVKISDHLLENVSFLEEDKGLKIIIELKYPLPSDKFKFFSLENPDRIVFDFYRKFEEKSITSISEDIVWTRIIQGNSNGRIIMNIVEADLSKEYIDLKAIQALDNNKGRETVTSMDKRSGAVVSINGGFYFTKGGPLGLVVIDGNIEALPVNTRPPRAVFAITEDKEILIDRVDVISDRLKSLSGEDWSEVIYAIGAGPNLITEGKINITDKEEELGPNGNDVTQRDSHTAMGITKDNKLIFFTVDGRKVSYSRGMSLKTIAGYLLNMGVVEAVCMDGGNSTAMIVQDKIVSETFDKERKVANCWSLFTEEKITSPAFIEVINKHYEELSSGGKYSLEVIIKDSSGNTVPDGTGVTFRASHGIIEPSFAVTDGGVVSVEITSALEEKARFVITSGVKEKDLYLDF